MPNTDKYLSNATRAQYKRALLKASLQSVGLTDAELEQEYTALNGGPLANSAAAAVMPEPEPEPIEEPAVVEVPAPVKRSGGVEGTGDAEQLAEILKRMSAGSPQQLDEERVINLIHHYSAAPKAIEITVRDNGDVNTSTIDTPHKMFGVCLTAANSGSNLYLVGTAGTGKTTLAKQLATALNLTFYYTGSVFQKYELFGYTDAKGEVVRTQFREAYEHGGLFLWDEIDGGDPQAAVSANAAIDNGVASFPDGVITMHPSFVCVATANTIGKGPTRQFVGRSPLDAATLDRFFMVELCIDEEIESAASLTAYLERGGEKTSEVNAWVEIVRTHRTNAEALGLTCIISPRASIDGAGLLAMGMSVEQVLQGTIFNKLSVDERAALEIK